MVNGIMKSNVVTKGIPALADLVEAEPGAISALVLRDGKLTEIWIPSLGGRPVRWRKHFGLTRGEAVEEAGAFRDEVRFAAERAARERNGSPSGISVWTTQLTPRTLNLLSKALRDNPNYYSQGSALKRLKQLGFTFSDFPSIDARGAEELREVFGDQL